MFDKDLQTCIRRMPARWTRRVAVLCCLGFGCSRAMQPDRDTGARIETLCGGGVAALYRGVTVYEDGRIFRIQRGPGKGRREIELHRDPKAFEDWNDRLDQAGFDQLEYDQPGNMTCSLERVRGQDRHKVSWRREQPPPEKIEAIFREIEARQKSNEDL